MRIVGCHRRRLGVSAMFSHLHKNGDNQRHACRWISCRSSAWMQKSFCRSNWFLFLLLSLVVADAETNAYSSAGLRGHTNKVVVLENGNLLFVQPCIDVVRVRASNIHICTMPHSLAATSIGRWQRRQGSKSNNEQEKRKKVAGKSARVANKSVAFEEATMPSSSKTILNQISGLVVENVSFLSVSLAPTVACVSGASSGWVQSVDTCKHFLTFSYPVIGDAKLASALPSARLYPTLTPWPHWKWCGNACSVAVVSALHFLRRHRAAAYARAASLDSRRFYWVILWLHHVLRTCNFITGAQSSNVKSPPVAAMHSGPQTHRRVREGERETWRKKKENEMNSSFCPGWSWSTRYSVVKRRRERRMPARYLIRALFFFRFHICVFSHRLVSAVSSFPATSSCSCSRIHR